MSNALSKGRYPRQPDRTSILTICKEDFRNFKDRNGNIIIEYLSSLIKDLKKRGLDPDIYIRQKENLEEVKTLVVKGKEKAAFSLFTRTFPYCMPHRSIR
jgi:hypothetical protein